jgi:hypothetical protein
MARTATETAERKRLFILRLCKYRKTHKQFAIIENIMFSPVDFCTRLRFDVAVYLASSEPEALSACVPKFVAAVYNRLYCWYSAGGQTFMATRHAAAEAATPQVLSPTTDAASAVAVVWTPTFCTTETLRSILAHYDILALNVVNG